MSPETGPITAHDDTIGSVVFGATGELNPHVCARFHAAVEMVGSRWTGAVLFAVAQGRNRYSQIKAAIPGLSDTMLAQRLRTMEAEELIERRAAEYHLTERGRDLAPVLQALVAWGHRWLPIEDAERAVARR